MKAYIGLGSNLGDRRANLERAVKHLPWTRVSPVLETAALVPERAPPEWRHLPFLNAVAEISWGGTPRELLQHLQGIERALGRQSGPRWAPRLIDLDLLLFGDLQYRDNALIVPHPQLTQRQFVLSALKHLRPEALAQSRALGPCEPLCMGIVNLTPDSFSDGGQALPDWQSWDRELVTIFDLGAESTRPGATPLTATVEWERLQPTFEHLREHFSGQVFRPWLSVDTYHFETAARAVAAGCDILNDVSGLKDERLLELLAQTPGVQYVLMHSLTVPTDPAVTVAGHDPVAEIKGWAQTQLARLERAGVTLERVFFDPGLGFGKTPQQSAHLARSLQRFHDLPVRLLVGHSRKRFLDPLSLYPARERDPETLGLSFHLAQQGVDVLRVHAAGLHRRALRAYYA